MGLEPVFNKPKPPDLHPKRGRRESSATGITA